MDLSDIPPPCSRRNQASLPDKRKGFSVIEMMTVTLVIGGLASSAMPTFKKVRDVAQMTAIENNLKQISHAANFHFFEYGVESVALSQLVGPGKHILELESVAGEQYPEVIELSMEKLSTTGGLVSVSILF